MDNIVVFGDLPIATKVVQFLETFQCRIFVVIGNQTPNNNDPWKDTPLLYDYAVSRNLPILSPNDIAEQYDDQHFTLGLSCRYSKIIRDDVLRKFRNGILNMHGGLLPEFGGLYSANHTILCRSEIGGGTIHYIDKGIDTGEIIKRCSFPVEKTDTAYSIFQKTQQALLDGMMEIIPMAIPQRLEGKQHKEYVREGYEQRYFDRHSLEGLKEIKIVDLDTEEAEFVIRAFDFPGYEPAYYVDPQGNKIYLRFTS